MITIKVELPELTWVVTCECTNRSFGDSLNDALANWGKHVTSTPKCREKL